MCEEKISKFRNICKNCHACQNFLVYSRYVRKHVFFSFLKIRQKPTSPAICHDMMRNNESISRSLRLLDTCDGPWNFDSNGLFRLCFIDSIVSIVVIFFSGVYRWKAKIFTFIKYILLWGYF